MAALDLALAKKHLRVDGSDDDDIIALLLSAVTAVAAKVLDRPVDDPALTEEAQCAVNAAILLALGDAYENRSSQATQQLYTNRAYMALLTPYRLNMGV